VDTRDERGQAVPLAIAVMVVVVVVTFAVASLGRNVVDAGRARTAADAAALAGVEGGRAAATRMATENGATVVSWSRADAGDAVTVTVTVRVGRATATAAATNRGP
jgi:hypothetical protein